jgi:parallel beta-helix repeat protein
VIVLTVAACDSGSSPRTPTRSPSSQRLPSAAGSGAVASSPPANGQFGLTAPPTTTAVGPTTTATLDTNYPIPPGAVFVGPSGDDAAAGTLSAPLRTVAKALARAPAGGTIVLRGGTYRETIASVTKTVTIQPYPHESAWLSGSDVVTGWEVSGRGWRSTTWRSTLCQTCYNPAAINAAHPLAGKPDQVFVDGQPLTQVADDAALTANTFYLASDNAIVIGTNPAGVTVEASSRWKAIQLNDPATGSTIRGIGFKQYAPVWDESQLAAIIVNTANVTFAGDIMTQTAGTALAVLRPGGIITGNTISRNGYRGMVANKADGLALMNNRFDLNNTAGFNTTSCGSYCTVAGAKVTHTRGLTVTANSFQSNAGSGFWCDLGCINAVITGNIVSTNTVNGLFYEVSANATLAGNVISRNGRGLKIAGSAPVAVTANTFTDNTTDLGIYDDPRSPSTDAYSAANGLTWDTADVTVTANTFTDTGGKTTTLLDTNKTAQVTAPGMLRTFAGNIFQPLGVGRVYWCAATCVSYPSITAFQAVVNVS